MCSKFKTFLLEMRYSDGDAKGQFGLRGEARVWRYLLPLQYCNMLAHVNYILNFTSYLLLCCYFISAYLILSTRLLSIVVDTIY